MSQEKKSLNPTHDLADPELLRDLAAFVRARRSGPRTLGLHTSDMVSSSVYRLLVISERKGRVLAREDIRRLAFRIARGVVVDAFRALARRVRWQGWYDSDDELPPQRELLETRDPQLEARLAEAMVGMNGDDHRLINMRLRGASWRQIASTCGLTDKAARKRWERLRRKLGKELGGR